MSTFEFGLFINVTDDGDYKVAPAHSSKPLKTCKTQTEAIEWAKKHHPDKACHVARVRDLNGTKKPDHWRKVH
jgi:hypothetical protein